MIPVQLLAIRLNEHQKLAEVKQAGSEMTKALSQNGAICCAYFHKDDSDRHYSVVGDVHLKGMLRHAYYLGVYIQLTRELQRA